MTLDPRALCRRHIAVDIVTVEFAAACEDASTAENDDS
jgi:hypothetical protein